MDELLEWDDDAIVFRECECCEREDECNLGVDDIPLCKVCWCA